MAKAKFVKKARKDNPVCKKGESYYWWKFKFGSKNYSLTPPKQSQLTQSDFLSQIYDIQDRINDIDLDSEFESEISEIVSDLESLRDEQEEKRDNMPEQLQDSGSGEMLQNRYDSIDEMISELESIDLEVEDFSKELEKEEDETEEEFNERVEQETESKKEEILSEIQEVCYNGE